MIKSSDVEDSTEGPEQDQSTSSQLKRRSVSPTDSQVIGLSTESDVEMPLYRHDRDQSAERSATLRSRRSQSMDDVRDDDDITSNVVADDNKTYGGDEFATNGNEDNNGNFTTDGEEEDNRLEASGTDDNDHAVGMVEGSAGDVRAVPILRAGSFKEAMRSSQFELPDFSRTLSQPPPTAAAMESGRNSRSSWVMPVFPSLEETFNEWFTSAMERTRSLGSSSSVSLGRSQSDTSSSTPLEGRGVQMRRPSRNSAGAETSPLCMPEFRTKRLSRLFDWEPMHLSTISGSSDSLDSSEVVDCSRNSATKFSTDHGLPPGFETGLFDHSMSFRPSLLSRMSQSLADPRFARHLLHSNTRAVSGNGPFDMDTVYETHNESRQSQSGSTSRVVPVRVITSRSSFDDEVVNAGPGPSGGSVETTADRRGIKTSVAKSKSSSFAEREHKPALSGSPLTRHSSQTTQRSTRLPAGFLTGFSDVSFPDTIGTKTTQNAAKTGDGRSAKIVSVSEMDGERKVRVIPISHGQNTESCEAQTRRQHSSRGRVIPVVVQSSASVHETDGSSDSLTSSQRPDSGKISIPVTVVQSNGGPTSNSSAAENVSQTITSGNYLPLCYDDESEETVKKILQEMTIRRLPIRDTVRLLNMQPPPPRSRSMDFLDSKRHAAREESPNIGDRNASVMSPTADLLPAGFLVGNFSRTTTPHHSSRHGAPTAAPSVTGDLVRKRLHQFDGSEANL